MPEKIDILITHGPPFGILDETHKENHAGSKGLWESVKKIKPRLHIFGHIHEGHGIRHQDGTIFMNVAKKIEIIDLPLKY
jgi:Icc-related predicted phosphoesterase